MSFNGAGQFVRLFNWVQDRNNGIKILATRMDQETDGIATGLSTCITKDGQTTVTADISLNTHKLTLLASGTIVSDAANVGQIQAGGSNYSSASGTNAYVVGMTPTLTSTAFADGFTASIYFPNVNTSAATATLNFDGLGATNLVNEAGTILGAGDVQVGVACVTLRSSKLYYTQAYSRKRAFNLVNGGVIATGATAPLNTFFQVDCSGTAQTMPTDGAAAAGDTMVFAKYGANTITQTLTGGQKFNGLTNNPVTANEGVSTQVYTGASRGWVEG